LTVVEAQAIRPSRIDFDTVRDGDTWESLAQRSGGAIRPSTLAVMNHSAPDAAPRLGARIRIVVAG
jgi:predicted Zn-dependent protease